MKRGRFGLALAAWMSAAGALAGGGYYLDTPGGRNVIWPPPGGVDAVQPPLGSYGPPAPINGHGPGWYWNPWRRPPVAARVPPPGADWPEALPAKAPPLQPGEPVEVVPPPGIPVDQVGPAEVITRQPHHEWRPVDPEAALQRATVKPPARPDRMRPSAPRSLGAESSPPAETVGQTKTQPSSP